jgi:hypothetical protein
VACKPSELLAGAHAASFGAGLVGDSVSCGDALAFAAIAGRGKKLHLAKKKGFHGASSGTTFWYRPLIACYEADPISRAAF